MVLVVPVSLTQNGNRCTASTFETEQYHSAAQLGCLYLGTTPQLCAWQVCHLGPQLETLCRDQLEASAVSATGGLCKRAERSFVCKMTA